MKMLLLLSVALAISAQTLDTDSSVPIPSEYLTLVGHEAHLNGYWWKNATAMEQQIYLMAWQDATGIKVEAHQFVYPRFSQRRGQELTMDLTEPIGDVIHRLHQSLRCSEN